MPKFLACMLCVILAALLSAFVSPSWLNHLYAQNEQQEQQKLPTSLEVRITSPSQGKQVPLGSLTVTGMSTDNESTECEVYVDRNNISPFQKVLAKGSGDYSNWTFTYAPPYASITEGNTNELTAKLSCLNNPINLTAFHTINVTGMTSSNLTSATVAPTLTPTLTPLLSPSGPFSSMSNDEDVVPPNNDEDVDEEDDRESGGSSDDDNDDDNDDRSRDEESANEEIERVPPTDEDAGDEDAGDEDAGGSPFG